MRKSVFVKDYESREKNISKGGYGKTETTNKCELCGSINDSLNFHHLIPRTLHNNKWFKKKYTREYMSNHGIWLCSHYCHKQIHDLISEKDMGYLYNTRELLLENPEIKRYIEWRSKRI
jgi:hypothetical protein